MAEDKMNPIWDPLERRIVLALEAAPRPEIPADFAARIAAQLAPLDQVTVTPRRYGQGTAVACLIVLMALMVATAPRATSPYWFSIELIFCAQFALLSVWLVVRGYTSANSF